MNCPRLLAALPLALACRSAAAQDVHRCEEADGRIGYASGTCPAGTVAVRTLPAADSPSAAEQKAAQQRVQQEMRRAAAIDRARLADEERAAREQAQQLALARKQEAHCRRLQTSVRHAQEDLAAARAQKRAELQRRLARAEELVREECGR
jgi:hypothetical protein